MERIKKRFNALYSLDDIGKINSSIGQMRRELKLFYTEERREWASPCLDFVERNSRGLFLSEKGKEAVFLRKYPLTKEQTC